ncbi:hypothetical protein KIPB_009835, partial [Kipferlia bialata]
SQFTISPDGTDVAFVTQVGTDVAWTTDDSVYLVPINGEEEPVCLTCDCAARDMTPLFSEDGSKLYYLGMLEAQSESDRVRLKVMEMQTRVSTVLSEGYDRSIDGIVFDPINEGYAYALVADTARESIFHFPLGVFGDDDVHMVVQGGACGSLSVTPEGILLYAMSTYTRPSDVYKADSTDGYTVRKLTTNNDLQINSWMDVREPVEMWSTSTNGDKVQSWYFAPAQIPTNGDKVPLILYVHGGPESPWEDAWSYRWNPQTLVSTVGVNAALIATNFHGSDSFGEEFTKSIRNHWFDIPYDDVLIAMQDTLDTYDYIDEERIGSIGASYGGTFQYWVAGQSASDERLKNLKCIVSHDGIFDLVSFAIDTDEMFFPF